MRLCIQILADSKAFLPNLSLLLLLSLFSIPFSLMLPLPVKILVDSVFQNHPLPQIFSGMLALTAGSTVLFACALEFAILLLRGLMNYGTWLYQIYLGERIVSDARQRLFRHVQQLSVQTHDRRGTADFFYRLQNDVGSVHMIAVNGLIPMFSTAVTFITMFIVTFRIDATLALLALGVLPITWLLSSRHLPKSRQRWASVKQADQKALGVLQEVLGSIRVVRAFSQEEREVQRFAKRAHEKLRGLISAGVREAAYGCFVSAAIAAASAAALYVGAEHIAQGKLSIGNFLIITTYLVQLFRPLDALSKQTSILQSALASAERYFALLKEPPSLKDRPDAQPFLSARGRIEIENLSFSYDDGAQVLSDVSFKIAPGERVGIVGATGSGKTTLLSLLMRFMDPSKGNLRLDGVDYRNIPLADFRRQFSIVLQEPVLFSGTIAENIAYGRPQASQTEIEAAARSAGAHEFIEAGQLGYQTQVGERGLSLSGGERQRISIARAFLTNAPILILDEPTSNLDVVHEAAIKSALEKLKIGRTTITVTHRVGFLDEYDKVLRICGGRLSEEPALSLATTLEPAL